MAHHARRMTFAEANPDLHAFCGNRRYLQLRAKVHMRWRVGGRTIALDASAAGSSPFLSALAAENPPPALSRG